MRYVILLGALAGSAACRTPRGPARVAGPNDRVQLSLEVAPTRVACTGVAPMRCLQVRTLPDTVWLRWYDPIEGFEFEEGFLWRLDVERRTVPHPPADGSSYAYRVLRVVSKRRA